MAEYEKKHGFIDNVKNGLSYISNLISAIIFPQISKGAEVIMKNIDDKIIQVEKRIIRKIFSLLIIGFGGIFLIFALFFFLIESLGWSSAVAYFSIGITTFVVGLMLKLSESGR